MSDLTFKITLHAPFLVGTGRSGDGLDDRPDPRTPLPASSLKGVMRDAAQYRLEINGDLVNAVFGEPGRASSWAWSDAQARTDQFTFARRSRNRIGKSGVAKREALAAVSEVWVDGPLTFQVSPLIPDPPPEHRHLLTAAAYAVTAVGMWRNRGMGTASIRPSHPLNEQQAQELAKWVADHRQPESQGTLS